MGRKYTFLRQANHSREIKRRIADGRYSLDLSEQKYAEHIEGTPQYINTAKIRGIEPSRLNITIDEAQKLIYDFSGYGEVGIDKKGNILDIEYCDCDKVIGCYYENGQWLETSRFAIYHGKRGSHIVPVRPRKGKKRWT